MTLSASCPYQKNSLLTSSLAILFCCPIATIIDGEAGRLNRYIVDESNRAALE